MNGASPWLLARAIEREGFEVDSFESDPYPNPNSAVCYLTSRAP